MAGNITSSKRRSFTIIESIMAVMLIAITLIVFIASAMTSFSYLRRTNELRAATLALQHEVSMVREMEFSDIVSLGSTFTPVGVSVLQDPQGEITKSSYGGSSTISKITFTLKWTAFDGGPSEKSIVTLITDHGINKK